MPSSIIATQPSSSQPRVRSRTWIYLFLGILFIAGFAYFRFVNVQTSFINNDFYRVLYEASNRFNENLNSLSKMHESGESQVAIRSLLPSYKRVKRTSNVDPVVPDGEYRYQISGQDILVFTSTYKAELNNEDIVPETVQGFSQYLFANKSGKVVAKGGGEKTISIVQMDDINLQLKKQSQKFNINFSNDKSNSDKEEANLPSYSSHVDMQLSYGDFRIFIFPFSLDTTLYQTKTNEVGSKLEQLYLVGLLPKQQLSKKGSGQWNISLLVVSLVSLIFMWTLIRLVLLPENHSITRFYQGLSQFASYGFYIVLVAMILSYLTQSGLQAHKTLTAQDHAGKIARQLEGELREVFNDLSRYRGFYASFVNSINQLQDEHVNQQDPLHPLDWPFDETITEINKALMILSDDLKSNCQGCSLNRIPPHFLAATSWKADIEEQSGINKISTKDAENLKKLVSYQAKPEELGVMSFFSGKLEATFDYKNEVFSSNAPREGSSNDFKEPKEGRCTNYITRREQSCNDFNAPKILTIFAANKQGVTNLPSIYYQESNSRPQAFNISHRNYYKRVRDYRGWRVDFYNKDITNCEKEVKECKKESFKNIYIQRLLNINDGTRGTTISVPMHQPHDDMNVDMSVAGYVLGADVVLPSVSLSPPGPFDLISMIVDRNTGDVLFHSDESRSLVENLFFAGNDSSTISQWIKAGLDNYSGADAKQLQGFYHGQPGKYTLAPSIIDSWAIVVFSPNDSLDSFMTNQFMYIVISFILVLALSFAIANFPRYWRTASEIKRKMALPKQLDNKRIMLICTALFTTNYGVFYISQLLQINSKVEYLYWLIPMITVIVLMFFIHYFYIKHFSKFVDTDSEKTTFKRGALLFVLGFGVTAWLHFGYLQYTGSMPLSTLNFNYEQQRCSGINKERRELTNMALKRYPNSVTQKRIPPTELLQVGEKLKAALSTEYDACQKILSVVEPSDYPKLNTLNNTLFGWGWFNTYILATDNDVYSEQGEKLKTEIESGLIFLSLVVLLALVWLWFYFNRKILWPKIYCPSGFLGHINHLCSSVAHMTHGQPEENLLIKIDTTQLGGVGLALLIRQQQADEHLEEKLTLVTGFDELFKISPILQLFSSQKTYLPNLKIDMQRDSSSDLLSVQIWDIETCLEKVKFRQCLLDLIMELKSLTISNKLQSFTIYSGFRSLRRVKMKDSLSDINPSIPEHAEYMSWSECLMDFTVSVIEDLQHNIDSRMLANEIKYIPELKYLNKYVNKALKPERRKRDWSLNDSDLSESGWATINFILLHADALYRFKWESCSGSEKVALYNLAKKHHLNPSNTDMIEHLAINGMIKVKHDYLEIINKSFAQFVLQAESKETMQELVSIGEAGVWKNYRLPLALFIVVIVGGIALTSGESIFIIIASIAGVLGTLGSLTSSANMLKGQFKE
ncbi:hypothetical protein [Cognaticolwellia beringensis]|uniref:Uncharacterized protein n=1 Tax=Cognaticolwellia beringensis TaxID=1967665 RepID=A0A222GC49_9GAMM|nr:hypothetical protein [Cognaticolwellia beringensis]ASP49371.1 hypothetical protein B5D82_17295 [Cognaticolwellia beringensis]